jgi:hypothetical protein
MGKRSRQKRLLADRGASSMNATETNRRRFPKFHLSTALILTFLAGGFLFANSIVSMETSQRRFKTTFRVAKPGEFLIYNPGQTVECDDGGDEIQTITMCKLGWPWTNRENMLSDFKIAGLTPPPMIVQDNHYELVYRWKISGLLADCGFAVVMLPLLGFILERFNFHVKPPDSGALLKWWRNF